MREILFRAKAINRIEGREYRTDYKNGDWVYGLITRHYNDMFPTLPMEMRNTNGVENIEFDYKTVGQFIGLLDTTKWEELSKEEQDNFLSQPQKDGTNKTEKDWKGKKIFEGDIVEYNGSLAGEYKKSVGFFDCDRDYLCAKLHGENFTPFVCKVIGNIHDNPELLEKVQIIQ